MPAPATAILAPMILFRFFQAAKKPVHQIFVEWTQADALTFTFGRQAELWARACLRECDSRCPASECSGGRNSAARSAKPTHPRLAREPFFSIFPFASCPKHQSARSWRCADTSIRKGKTARLEKWDESRLRLQTTPNP